MRYIDSLNLENGIECFILIEPGFGYIIPVLREKFKTAKILALHIADFPVHSGVPSIKSGESEDIENFLEANLPDVNSNCIRVIEWRPSLNYYKESYLKLLSQVVRFIKRINASERTTAAFGKRWIKNFFKNTASVKNCLLYKETSVPVIITGSGPGLEQVIPVIQKAQERCLIIAASSSAEALFHYGIRPDFIIATDGGSWALRHLYACFRKEALRETNFLAVNLCAALPSQCEESSKLIINDGSLWQSIALHELEMPSVVIPQRGTVTATAADLALILSSGNIYLAGMDFSASGIRTHVKPYNFDGLFLEKANRFSPFYSESFTRSFLIHHGGSMDIYAAWFKNQLALWPKRIFSAGSGGIFEDGNALLESYLNTHSVLKNIKNNFKAAVVKEDSPALRAKNALLAALKEPKYADKLKKELASLLFPGEKNVAEQELESALDEIAHNGGQA